MITKIFSYDINIVNDSFIKIDKLNIDLLYFKYDDERIFVYNYTDLCTIIKNKYGSDDFIIDVYDRYNNVDFVRVHLIEVNTIKFNNAKLKYERKNKIQTFI